MNIYNNFRNLATKETDEPKAETSPPKNLSPQGSEDQAADEESQKGSISSKTSDNTRDSSKEEKTAIEKSIESDDLSKHDASTEEQNKTDDQQISPSENEDDMVTPMEYGKAVRVSSVVEDYKKFPGAIKMS